MGLEVFWQQSQYWALSALKVIYLLYLSSKWVCISPEGYTPLTSACVCLWNYFVWQGWGGQYTSTTVTMIVKLKQQHTSQTAVSRKAKSPWFLYLVTAFVFSFVDFFYCFHFAICAHFLHCFMPWNSEFIGYLY